MRTFVSCTDIWLEILPKIVLSDTTHAKWLNTLSYLENSGARKIAACEHPTKVKEEMLKHAAEEFRHAHHLKRQIAKMLQGSFEDYSVNLLLGGVSSLHYLHLLDVRVSRYLANTVSLSKYAIKELAYLLVTYAIELRADELYPVYERILRASSSKVTVKSILLEEKEHLQEMELALQAVPHGFFYAEEACAIEGRLCVSWLQAVEQSI